MCVNRCVSRARMKQDRVVLGLSLAMALGVFGTARESAAQESATLWYRTGRSLGVEPGQRSWQAAQDGATHTENGITFTFGSSPFMGLVETTENGRYSQVFVGCGDRARTRMATLVVGRRSGRRRDIQAVVDIYCGPTAPQF